MKRAADPAKNDSPNINLQPVTGEKKMHTNGITYPQETPTAKRPRGANEFDLYPGDEVLVWDARTASLEWFVLLDVVMRADRQKLRIEGNNFYFDSACVKAFRLNHYVSKPTFRREAAIEDDWALTIFSPYHHVDHQAGRTIY